MSTDCSTSVGYRTPLCSPSISHPAATKSFNSSFCVITPAFDQGCAVLLRLGIAPGEGSSQRPVGNVAVAVIRTGRSLRTWRNGVNRLARLLLLWSHAHLGQQGSSSHWSRSIQYRSAASLELPIRRCAPAPGVGPT